MFRFPIIAISLRLSEIYLRLFSVNLLANNINSQNMQNSNKAEHGFKAEYRHFSYELLKFQNRFDLTRKRIIYSFRIILFFFNSL